MFYPPAFESRWLIDRFEWKKIKDVPYAQAQGQILLSDHEFSSLALHPDLLANLDSLGYSAMTPIQRLSLPVILAGKDIIGQAKTGSGKTAAFGLGVLQKLDVRSFYVQALVLCPTRELADQVAKEIRSLGRKIHNIKVLTLCGGVPFRPQRASLEHGAHIIVGTPGRVEDHLRKRTLDLRHVKTFVLDEADCMLDMGFQPVIHEITAYIPSARQTLLFSATFQPGIEQLAERVTENPERLAIDSIHEASTIKQYLYRIEAESDRINALELVLLERSAPSSLVFCNTRQTTKDVADALEERGFSAAAIHGDLDQRERENRLVQFANKSLSVLVATDVAARGLDIESLDVVINYQISRDLEVHTHRIGRTGRAGNKGVACAIYTGKESYRVKLLESLLGETLEKPSLPDRARQKVKPTKPPMVTIELDGGKRQKVRAGDIVGALTSEGRIDGTQVGKINLFDQVAYIAIERQISGKALEILNGRPVKGRTFRARLL